MMKRMYAAFFIAVLAASIFVSCGSAKETYLGLYTGTTVSIAGREMPFSELYDGENSIELKSKGSAVFIISDTAMNCSYRVDGSALVITHDEISSTGTIEDGLITLTDFFGMEITMKFEKE